MAVVDYLQCGFLHIYSNTLVAVGLRPTREESRHWDAVKGIVLNKLQEDSSQNQDVMIQASHSAKDTPLIRHVSGYDFSSAILAPSVVEPDGGAAPQPFLARKATSVSGRQMSVRATGRSQVIPMEPKPDIWKLAFNSIRTLSKVCLLASNLSPEEFFLLIIRVKKLM